MSGFISQVLEQIVSLQHSFQELGWAGVAAYALFLAVVQVTLAPMSPFSIAAGLIFGLQRGFLAVMVGTAAGAAINFLIARHAARRLLEKKLAGSVKFQLIDAAIGREGWKIVALLRFCPIPFGLANFCYGLTAIAFWPYLAASVVAIIPGNFFFAYLGSTAHEGIQALTGAGRPHHPGEYILMGFGLAATFVALTYIGKIAKAALAKAEPTAVVIPEVGV